MTSIRIIASLIVLAGAHRAMAQSPQSAPTPPAPAQPQAVKLPPTSPPPPRPRLVTPTSQRTPTPPLGIKPAPNAALVKPSTVHPDSARAATARVSTAAIAAVAPPARLSTPPRTGKTATTQVVAANIVGAQPRPVGATMRCKDGTYLTGPASNDRCTNNGGVAAIFAAQSAAPAPPRPQPQKRP